METINVIKRAAYLLCFAGVVACNNLQDTDAYTGDADANIAETGEFDMLEYAKQQQQESEPYTQEGEASYYARSLQGSKMANGKPYQPSAMTAAHRKLPLGTKVQVYNDDNDSLVVVEITDRGPYAGDRIIDLSRAAAKELDFIKDGTTDVEIQVVEPANGYTVSDSVAVKK